MTPAAACTVLLRYSEFAGQTWDYSTACQRAVELGLADNSMLQAATISRGDLAVMIFRAVEIPSGDQTSSERAGIHAAGR